MEETKYFLHQIKRTNRVFDKGIVIKDTFDAAQQSYHAYLGAYAFGQNEATDYVCVMISSSTGSVMMTDVWEKAEETEEGEA